MRKLSHDDFEALLERLGYFREENGGLVSSGVSTGPKGTMWVAELEPGDYFTVYEVVDFLCSDRVGLLEEEVEEALLDLGFK